MSQRSEDIYTNPALSVSLCQEIPGNLVCVDIFTSLRHDNPFPTAESYNYKSPQQVFLQILVE